VVRHTREAITPLPGDGVCSTVQQTARHDRAARLWFAARHGKPPKEKPRPRASAGRGWLSGDSRPGTRTGLSSHCADRVKDQLTLRKVTPSRAACRASAPWSGMLPTPTSRVMSSRNNARTSNSGGEGQHPEPGAHRGRHRQSRTPRDCSRSLCRTPRRSGSRAHMSESVMGSISWPSAS
jgi:hypothetical protein